MSFVRLRLQPAFTFFGGGGVRVRLLVLGFGLGLFILAEIVVCTPVQNFTA